MTLSWGVVRVVAVPAHMRRSEFDLVDPAGEEGMAGEPYAIPKPLAERPLVSIAAIFARVDL